jgi:SAM-dependent methyltransferase
VTVTGLAGHISHCGICGSWDLKPVLDMGCQPLPERYGSSSEPYPLALLECKACTLVQLSYIAPQREVFAPDHSYSSGNTKALRDHFASLAAQIAPSLKPDDLVVDLGCNDGSLLEAVRRAAPEARLVGVEPTGQARKCEAKGIATYREFFTDGLGRQIRAEHGLAKVVTACNVLAHVPAPRDFMSGVTRLLADDGVFVTENHDVFSVLGGLQIDTVYHEHLRYYSVTSLSRLLGMHGLAVARVEHIPTHGGSFRAWAGKQQTGDLEKRAQQAAKALRALLDGAAQQGLIYGVGAATRAAPLIHYAQIAGYLACVCEIPGSDKIGKTMPGSQIPVVDEAKLIADQPPYALLLSWHLADSIVPALRVKGYEGRFIVPLPEPKVLDGV